MNRPWQVGTWLLSLPLVNVPYAWQWQRLLKQHCWKRQPGQPFGDAASRRPGLLRISCTIPVQPVPHFNPSETLLLEGQAFYVSLAPSQYSLPLTSTTAETQTANEAKQKQCATHITSMMKMSKEAIVASTGTAPTFADTLSTGTPGKFGYD